MSLSYDIPDLHIGLTAVREGEVGDELCTEGRLGQVIRVERIGVHTNRVGIDAGESELIVKAGFEAAAELDSAESAAVVDSLKAHYKRTVGDSLEPSVGSHTAVGSDCLGRNAQVENYLVALCGVDRRISLCDFGIYRLAVLFERPDRAPARDSERELLCRRASERDFSVEGIICLLKSPKSASDAIYWFT